MKRHIVVDGGARGERRKPIRVQGSKNIFLHVVALSFAARDGFAMVLRNAPQITDRNVLIGLLRIAGATVAERGSGLEISGVQDVDGLDHILGARVRPTMCYASALAAVNGRARSPLPGGDSFTVRPIDVHLRVVEAAGAEVRFIGSQVEIQFRKGPRPFAVDVATRQYGPSLGATVSALLVGAVASGRSVIVHPSREPEVMAVSSALRAFGVEVDWTSGADEVVVRGRGSPLTGEGVFTVPGDRMEGGTYLLAGLLLSGIAELDGLPIASLPVGFLEVLDALGVEVTSWHASRASGGGGVRATCSGKISAVRFSTAAHPGFPTDLQPQMAAFLSQAHGMSRITETVYDKRDSHIRQLEELGVKIDVSGRTQTISGPQRLVSGCCSPRDIRCAAAVVVAAAASKGTTGIVDDGCLRRGYSNLLENLDALGLDVRDVYTL